MNFEDLKNPKLQERLQSAKTAEELLAIVREAGLKLSNAELAGISGGIWCSHFCDTLTYCDNDGPL